MKAHVFPVDARLRADMIAVVEPAELGLPALKRAGFGPPDNGGRGDTSLERGVTQSQPVGRNFLSMILRLLVFPQAGHHWFGDIDARGVPFGLQDPDRAVRLPRLDPGDRLAKKIGGLLKRVAWPRLAPLYDGFHGLQGEGAALSPIHAGEQFEEPRHADANSARRFLLRKADGFAQPRALVFRNIQDAALRPVGAHPGFELFIGDETL